MIALLIAAQAMPEELLGPADEANGAYVQCLFAVSRAANRARLSVDEFERKLASACLAEEEALVRTGIPILRLKGEPDPASRVKQEAQEARRSVLDTYRKVLELRR